jgi:hypothetical protein
MASAGIVPALGLILATFTLLRRITGPGTTRTGGSAKSRGQKDGRISVRTRRGRHYGSWVRRGRVGT